MRIKTIATIAAIGPINVKLGNTSLISNGICSKSNEGLIKLISEAAKLAAIDEIAKAVTAFIEKCLNTVSWAKIIPAKGAPKPAEIAAATPQPIIMSWGILGTKDNLLKNAETVAPKCTNGP